MSLFEVGRLCVKIAGRDAGRTCVVVEELDNNYVVVDGATRRKKVNVLHLEPLADMVKMKAKASHDEVKKAFERLGLAVWETKPKKTAARPRKQKKVRSNAQAATEKTAKKAKAAKEEAKAEKALEAPAEA